VTSEKLHITFHKAADQTVLLPGSKSESNRALIIDALTGWKCEISNLSVAEDTQILKNALHSEEQSINVKNAGTAMRFLTAYYAATNQEKILTGNERMQQRPIKPLVDALCHLAANISYIKSQGYPPLKINPSLLNGGKIRVPANISSQFISALLMIAPALKNGLIIELDGPLTSRSYIEMTLSIMKHFEVDHSWENNVISISSNEYSPKEFNVESDWTSASYWYSLIALSEKSSVFLKGLKRNSFQGDSVTQLWAEAFGVVSEYSDTGVFITKGKDDFSKFPHMIDFKDHPDLAQTFIPLFAAKDIACRFTGLESLRIKETDRITALQNELKKFDVHLLEESKDIYCLQGNFNHKVSPVIETYDDHRMAMSFTPLSVVCRGMTMIAPGCVVKSYPAFWDDIACAGFEIDTL
jgi:3-phosphoshikimate 1-carboxyvinyltransferase